MCLSSVKRMLSSPLGKAESPKTLSSFILSVLLFRPGILRRHLICIIIPCLFTCGRCIFGVFDAMMEYAAEGFVEAFGDFVKILESEFALVQLSIGEDFVDNFLDH